jgi:hypothetical protein
MGTWVIGKRRRVVAVLFWTWLAAACGVDRGSIGGLSGTGGGGSSAGNGGTPGAGGSGGDSGSSGNSGTGGGGTSGAGGSAGVISSDASLDSAVNDAEMNDASTTPDASAADSGVPVHPDSCAGFRPLGGTGGIGGGTCPSGWTTVDGITCRRVCMGVGPLSNCSDTTIACPPGFACEVECQGVNTCPDKTIACSDGPCSLVCGGVNSCSGVTLQCASDRCAGSCTSIMLGSVTASNQSASCAATNTCQ